MKLQKLLISCCLLTLPITSFAIPTHKLWIESYNSNGFNASSLHRATGCYNSGYMMCGSAKKITGGVLNMTWVASESKFRNIHGVLDLIGGHKVKVQWGNLSDDGFGVLKTKKHGTFKFDDLSSFYSGAANNYKDKQFYLWGQNFNPRNGNSYGKYKGKDLGLDLYGKVTAVPEPATLSLMTLGLLGLGAVARKKKFA